MRDDGQFLKDLREEIAAAEKRRADFVKQKFLFVIGLLSIGGLSAKGHIDALWALYAVPIVAFSFDLYIYGEDFGVRRAGAFFRQESANAPANEKEWEQFVDRNRDPLRRVADVLLSVLVLLGAAVTLYVKGQCRWPYWAWLVINVCAVALLRIYHLWLRRLK